MLSNLSSPTTKSFLEKYEFIIPLLLFVIFLVLTIPGISWGAPSFWHPDEIVKRSIGALHGKWIFDTINFDYPTLPQYAMLGLGRIILNLGRGDRAVLIACRILSALLGGVTIILAYIVTRRMGKNIYVSGLSGLLLLCVSEMEHNGRFAHNDMYITLFVLLTILCLLNYQRSGGKFWLYSSFITVGMAASSKYNGISLVVVPVLLYLFSQRHLMRKKSLSIFGTLFIGALLTFGGFAVGTPTALLRPVYYFSHMIPALLHTGNYARQPDSVRGIIGQYPTFADGLGLPLFLLFSISIVWACYKIYQSFHSKAETQTQTEYISILLLGILALDLPMMISYNYQVRFFLPMMPILAMLAALFIGDLYSLLKQKQVQILGTALLAFVILFSLARVISVMFLFLNDARIPASAYVEALPYKTTLEYTYYPPTIPVKHFSREYNYPIYFIKVTGDPLPTSPKYVFNVGEAGLNERQTDYLVVDSFTDRFNDPYICQSMQVECDFFKQLATGRSDHYQLIADFSYSLPPFLPQIQIAFVNPEIRIYERIK